MNHDVSDVTLAVFVLLGELMDGLVSKGVLTDAEAKQTIANAMNKLEQSGDQGMRARDYLIQIYGLKD